MKAILSAARRRSSVLLSIYVLGTIGGILICLLEAVRIIRFYHYARLPLWDGKLILASNHPGWLDVVILPMLYFPWWFKELGERTRLFLALPIRKGKKEATHNIFVKGFKEIPVSTADEYNFRYFRWALEGWNIFINRQEEKIGARASILRKAAEILENNGRIIIFPGGGRDFKAAENGDGIYDIESQQMIMRRPKLGVGWVVKQTGATIVPIRIEGTDKVLPNKANERLPRLLKPERYILRIWHPTIIKIGEPIRFTVGTTEESVLERYVQAQIELYHEGNGKK